MTRAGWFWPVIGIAVAGAGLSVAGRLDQPERQAFSYLAAFGFISSTLVGGLGLLAMMYAVGARWFVVFRHLCLGVAACAPAVPLLFLPIALSLRSLYSWVGSPSASADSAGRALVFGQPWMSTGPFLLRSAFYLFLWLALAEALRRAARAREQQRASWFLARRVAISAAALPVLVLSGTWAGFDWLMSAVPGWNMTSLGLYVLTGGFASALGVLAVLVHLARLQRVLPAEVGAAHSLALGRLLFAAVCLWAYIAVSQLIIVWIADLPREAAFYLPRARGGFRYLAALLVLGHFIVPFLLLLSRKWKAHSGFVAVLGAWIVLMHAVDMYWLLVPTSDAVPSLLDLGPFLLLGALALAMGIWRASALRAVPVNDPDLARSLGYESP